MSEKEGKEKKKKKDVSYGIREYLYQLKFRYGASLKYPCFEAVEHEKLKNYTSSLSIWKVNKNQ